MNASTTGQSHQFQAEVAELLNLMVHSVYSETDIFLRELISNASDALDKVRYEAIAQPDLLAGNDRLAIRIAPNAEAKTLTISDSGIGMDRQELIDNLGTLARSGTKASPAPGHEGRQGEPGPDRPVRRGLLCRLHGRRPDRGDQPPRGRARCLGLDLVGRSRLRGRGRHGRADPTGAARHRDRAASQGRGAEVRQTVRARADRADLFRPHPLPDRAGRREGRGAPDQCGQRPVAALEVRSENRRITPRPIARSRWPSTSPR